MILAEWTNLVAIKESNVVTYFKMKRGFYVVTGNLRSRHKDKLNIDKQGRDRLFYVATKILTQGREVLSQHNKLGRDIKMS